MLSNGPDNLQKSPFPIEISGPPSNTWFLGPTGVSHPNGISIGTAVFAGLTNVTNKQTHRQTDHDSPSVAMAHILCNACDAA